MPSNTSAVCFENANGDSLRLRLLGYQFPNIENDEWDSNWLIIEGQAVLDGKPWEFRDPCLLTWEVAKLADWFELVAKKNEATSEISFIELNLEFSLVNGVQIRALLNDECRPPWASHDVCERGDFYLDFFCSAGMLMKVAADLRAQLVHFPERARG